MEEDVPRLSHPCRIISASGGKYAGHHVLAAKEEYTRHIRAKDVFVEKTSLSRTNVPFSFASIHPLRRYESNTISAPESDESHFQVKCV
ncbi:hypothetical protein TNCV_4115951 [Trichonephila clavipes]|nr:hypothetical protein TNCV_4115951 [Trichonephila clavipes]